MSDSAVQGSFLVRASGFGELFDCAHRWESKHILGMRLPSSPAAAIGTAVHAGTAAFDQARVIGEHFRPADAADVVIASLDDSEAEGIDWNVDPDVRRSTAERIALACTTRYCVDVSPRYTFVGVEEKATPLSIDCGGGIVITLTGTLDRTRRVAGQTGKRLADVKTGRRAIKDGVAVTGRHRAQVGTYVLLDEHTHGETHTADPEIIAISTAANPETPVAVAPVPGARELMVGGPDYPGLIEHAAAMFRSGLFPPNPASSLCSARYCPRWATCRYHE